MNNNEISNLINLYNSLEIRKNAAHYMFGKDSKFTVDCVNQFLNVSHKIIENDLQSYLLEKIDDCENDSEQIDFSEFDLYIETILLKDPYKISNLEFNLVVYYAVNQICDLSKYSEFWSEENRITFLTIHKYEYLKLKRGPVINSILS